MKAISALILAAGESKRFGSPKQLLEIDGRTLLNRVISVVNEADVHDVTVVLGAHAELIIPTISNEASILQNPHWKEGMGSTLRMGVSQKMGSKGIMVLVADQPNLKPDHLKNLIDTFVRVNDTVCSRYNNINGVPAIFHPSQFKALTQLKGDQGARKLLEVESITAIRCTECAFDIDTLEDWETIVK
ncbi:MAG: nucleotidyltransferase family protein [Cyclobacteriaceae bacterium]